MIAARTVLLAGSLLSASLGAASARAYEYPIANPFAATVIGTLAEDQAPLPEKIRLKQLELTVFEDRVVPEVIWYDQRLKYSLAYQKRRAPLVFAIAGTGAGYNSPNMLTLQKALFQAGFHVIALSSPTHPNFIPSASTTGLPGHLFDDSRDLYRVMELAWQQVKDRVDVSEFYLTGYSLGGAQAAFVSKLDDEKGVFGFKKVLMINPPVSLYNSVSILDRMLEENVPGGLDNFNAFFERVMGRFAKVYRKGDYVEFSGEFLYAGYKEYQPDDPEIAALIGFAFRISSANMVITSDVFTNAGYIAPRNRAFSISDSVTDYAKVAFRTSFIDYFEELFLPYFQARDPGLTRQSLIDSLSLKSIESYLTSTDKVAMMTNADDVILAPGELDYLRGLFGSRAKIYPTGGHCGNLGYKDNVADLVAFFKR